MDKTTYSGEIATDIYTSHWTICFGNCPEDCPQIMRSWSHSYRIAVRKPWRSPPYNHQHFSGFWFCTTRLQNCYYQTPAQKPSLDQNVLKNYSPISSLPFLSTIFEKVILQKRLAHLQENNFWNPFKSAYRTGHSTDTALLRVVNDLLNAMDEDKISVFTLTGAFSCVWHYRSSDSSFPSRNCLWHQLYRSPVVSIVPSGQISVSCCQQFCFLFFSSYVWCSAGFSVETCAVCLYTTPLSDIIANHSVNHQPFADDTQLQKSTPPNDVQSLTHDLRSCTDDKKAWMCNNQLKLNEDKTEAILFSTPSLSSCHCLPSSVMVGTYEIQFSDKVRTLGFILDSNRTVKQGT